MNSPKKRLCVFDFDCTLIDTPESKVRITHKTGETSQIDHYGWKTYKTRPGDVFDFSDFEKIINPQKIMNTWEIFMNRLKFPKTNDVVVLSARITNKALIEFFEQENIVLNDCVALSIPAGDNNGTHKSKWIVNKLTSNIYNHVEFYDDRGDCVTEVVKLRKKLDHPVDVWQVLDGVMNYVD